MRLKSILFTLFLFVMTASVLIAQSNIKIGYTNPEYVMSLMPKYKQAESELQSYHKQLQVQLESKMKDYQAKLEAYQKDLDKLTDVVKQDKEKELIGLQASIKEFQENADVSIQKKEAVLLDPLIQEVQKAIDAVAEENGYTYIFSASVGGSGAIILYAKNKEEDISDLVLKKLGITPPAKSEGGTSTTPKPTAPINTNPTNTGTNTTAPVKKK
jgi:outer membrane protein